MLAWKGDLDAPSPTFEQGFTVVPASNGGEAYCWIATARTIETDTGSGQANVNDDATRTATHCYIRGLKERIEISSSSDDAWRWRRIVFSFKGDDLINDTVIPGLQVQPWLETSAGYVRVVPRITNTSHGPTERFRVRLHEHLFKGVFNKDWDNVMNAKLTTEHVNIISDKIVQIKSGNGKGVFRTVKQWQPINKTLIYNDFEEGGSKTPSALSANANGSVGDIYVMDFFEPLVTGAQSLRFWPQASLYWHER
jgi:hypothetical protein